MTSRRTIRLDHLHKAYDEIVGKSPTISKQSASTHLGLGVLRVFLGMDWLNNYVLDGAPNKNIFTMDEGDVALVEKTRFQVTDLAEVLFNLQSVSGFYECVDRLKRGDIEGTVAELDLGRMLFIHKVRFRYVVPILKKGADYDVEIEFPNGIVACADAKCKIEGREFSARTLENTLQHARKQLPTDRPGIIFIKHPQEWHDLPDFPEQAQTIATNFLRKTRRIVSVKYYVQPILFTDGFLIHRHGYKEYSNPTTRFGDMINWNLFRTSLHSQNLGGMPDHWQRIILFPDGLPDNDEIR
jgi:hypothetical protein